MNCDEVRPMLLDYVMEEVSSTDCAGIAQHLETCSDCSEEVGKLRQTLGLLVQGAAFEEIPQRIRIVAEPAGGWWHWVAAFWRHPERLAFAGGALACLAIALLALAQTTIRYHDSNFEIAFGAAAASVQSPAAAPAPTASSLKVVPATQTLTREQMLALINQAIAASEARQNAGTTRLIRTSVKAAEAQAESNRMNDRRELAESFRYIQAAQVNMWKEQIENQQVVSALVQHSGLQLPPQP